MRQGCSLTPPLFNLCSGDAINEIKNEIKKETKNTERKIEEAMNVTEIVFSNYNMKITIGITKAIGCRIKSGK